MPRRSKEQIRRDRLREWQILRGEWSYQGICHRCGVSALVRGKTKRLLRCKDCFVG